MHDITLLLEDTANRMREGSISQKLAASTAYMAFVMMMALKEARAEKDRIRTERLKACGNWPEPVIPPKVYEYMDKFLIDCSGSKFVLEHDPCRYINGYGKLKPERDGKKLPLIRTKMPKKLVLKETEGQALSELALAKAGVEGNGKHALNGHGIAFVDPEVIVTNNGNGEKIQ